MPKCQNNAKRNICINACKHDVDRARWKTAKRENREN